jgi:predicted nucleic acid-binding Zn ribbon protein
MSDEPSDGTDPASLDAALDRARRAARRRGLSPVRRSGRPASTPRRSRRLRSGELPELTGPGPDERDPQPIGDLVTEVVAERAWTGDVAIGSIAGRWAEIVGAEIAAHARPDRYEKGHLVVVAESTAWAAQLRLLADRIRSAFDTALGPGVVTEITVRGPTAPGWRAGPWRVAGRGPRDTYG